jgi:hypothetical protein
VTDYCLIENWLGLKMIELRRFIRETDEMATVALLEQVRADLEASRLRHRENCPNCFGRPTWGDHSDDPKRDESLGLDLGAVIRYKSTPPAPSRREATTCRKH